MALALIAGTCICSGICGEDSLCVDVWVWGVWVYTCKGVHLYANVYVYVCAGLCRCPTNLYLCMCVGLFIEGLRNVRVVSVCQEEASATHDPLNTQPTRVWSQERVYDALVSIMPCCLLSSASFAGVGALVQAWEGVCLSL